MLRAWVMGLYLKGWPALQAALAVSHSNDRKEYGLQSRPLFEKGRGERVRSPGKIAMPVVHVPRSIIQEK
jgi:hypothetical protein